MSTRKSVIISSLLVFGTLAIILIFWSRLPEAIPSHWNIRGEVDDHMSRGGFLGFFLALTIGLASLLLILPSLSPKGFEVSSWRPIYNLIVTGSVGLLCAIHLMILAWALGAHFDMSRILIGVILLCLGWVGNLLGKVKKNFWVGVRTPWTLASDRVWVATHRLAARLMFGSGLIGGIAVLLGVPVLVVFPIVMAAMLYPVVYSYLIYRKLELR